VDKKKQTRLDRGEKSEGQTIAGRWPMKKEKNNEGTLLGGQVLRGATGDKGLIEIERISRQCYCIAAQEKKALQRDFPLCYHALRGRQRKATEVGKKVKERCPREKRKKGKKCRERRLNRIKYPF